MVSHCVCSHAFARITSARITSARIAFACVAHSALCVVCCCAGADSECRVTALSFADAGVYVPLFAEAWLDDPIKGPAGELTPHNRRPTSILSLFTHRFIRSCLTLFLATFFTLPASFPTRTRRQAHQLQGFCRRRRLPRVHSPAGQANRLVRRPEQRRVLQVPKRAAWAVLGRKWRLRFTPLFEAYSSTCPLFPALLFTPSPRAEGGGLE